MLVKNGNTFQFLTLGTSTNHHLLHKSSVTTSIKSHWPSSQILTTMDVMQWMTQFTATLQALNYFCITFQYSLKRFYTQVENSYFPS